MAKLPLGVSVNASLLWQAEEGTAERVLRSQSVRARRKHPNAHFQAALECVKETERGRGAEGWR